MKKHLLTLALGLMMGSSAFAQVEFVDAEGNIIPDGSTVVRNVISTPFELPGVGKNQQVDSNISAKNTSDAAVSVKSQLDVTDLPFGQLKLCFPGDCWINVCDLNGAYPSHKPVQTNLSADGPWNSPNAGTLAAGATLSLQTEWILSLLGSAQWDGTNGSFTATYSLLVNDQKVSTINVLYSTDPNATGIAHIKNDAASQKEVGRYTIDGQKMAQGAKGLAIVKYADGSAKKVVIK